MDRLERYSFGRKLLAWLNFLDHSCTTLSRGCRRGEVGQSKGRPVAGRRPLGAPKVASGGLFQENAKSMYPVPFPERPILEAEEELLNAEQACRVVTMVVSYDLL